MGAGKWLAILNVEDSIKICSEPDFWYSAQFWCHVILNFTDWYTVLWNRYGGIIHGANVFFLTFAASLLLWTDSTTQLVTATAAGVGVGTNTSQTTLLSYNQDVVNSAQFIQLLDLFLADTTSDIITRQLMTFVCEGFVQAKDQRVVRRQQVCSSGWW